MISDPTAIAIATDPRSQRMSGVTNHGHVAFDVPYISHIEGNLYQGGCATGLVLPPDIEHVVSLYPWEQYTVQHQLKSYTFHWLYDAVGEVPPLVTSIATWVAACVKDGPTLVHCQAGLNRSSLIAALVLMWSSDRDAEATIAFLRERRSPAALCNPSFENYLRDAA